MPIFRDLYRATSSVTQYRLVAFENDKKLGRILEIDLTSKSQQHNILYMLHDDKASERDIPV